MKNLVQRLRELSALIYGLGGKIVIDEAADAIEKLEAENAALQIRLDVTINNYGYTTRECSDLRTENAALKAELAEVALLKNLLHIARQERDAAQAELAALHDQKPVAYWIPKAEQFCFASPTGRPFAKAWEPLYAAPGAK